MPDIQACPAHSHKPIDPTTGRLVERWWTYLKSLRDGYTSLLATVETTIDAAVQEVSTRGLHCATVTFEETDGAGTYTGSVTVPAGATLIDIVITNVMQWSNSGTVNMNVGDAADPDGYYTQISLKALQDLPATYSVSFGLTTAFGGGSVAGAYLSAISQVRHRYYAPSGDVAADHVITGAITASSTGGGDGRTRMLVVWAWPSDDDVAAATKA